MDPAQVTLLLVFGLVSGIAWWLAEGRRRSDHQQRWARWVVSSGLPRSMRPRRRRGLVEAQLGDRHVQVRLSFGLVSATAAGLGQAGEAERTVVEVPLAAPLLRDPEEILRLLEAAPAPGRVSHALARRYSLDLALEPEAVGCRLRVSDAGMVLDGISRLVENAVELARAIEEAALHPWAELAREHRLALSRGPSHEPELRGRIGRVHVEVTTRRRGAEAQLIVRALVPAELPRGLRIRGPDLGEPSAGLRIGDPVLDPMLMIDADDKEATRRLFLGPGADALRGLLLEMLRGRPGSAIEGGTVLSRGPGSGEHLAERVKAAVELAEALARAVEVRLEASV